MMETSLGFPCRSSQDLKSFSSSFSIFMYLKSLPHGDLIFNIVSCLSNKKYILWTDTDF